MLWQAEQNPTQYEGETEVDGRLLQMFKILKVMSYGSDHEEVRHWWRVWVDPERGHFPVRAEVENEAGVVWKFKGCVELNECSGGRWVPRRWFEAERNRLSDGSFDPMGGYWVAVTEILELTVDEPLGEELFRIAVEPGMFLFHGNRSDDRSAPFIGQTYRLLAEEIDTRWFKEDGSLDPPPGVVDRVSRNPADFVPSAPRSFHLPGIWAIGGVILIAIVALAYRFRQKGGESR